MENKNQKDSSDYQFIREKVVSTRKRRWRRMLLWSAFTVFLAILFGLVARLVFLCSDEPLKRFLGIAEPSRGTAPGQTPVPSPTPSPALSATPPPSPTPAGQPFLSPTGQAATLSGQPELTPSGSPEVTEPAEPSPSAVPVSPVPTRAESEEERAERVLADYAALYAAVQKMAAEVQRSLVTVEVIEDGVDWLENPYETKSQTTGIVIDKTAGQLLVLVNLDRIQNASRILVMYGKESFEAELWNYDRDYNLAVVRLSAGQLPEQLYNSAQKAVFGDSALLRIGTPIAALGNPNGYVGSMELGMVTSRGSISYITDNSVDLFNTDTSNSADSDGIIVNMKGEIVGIITRTLKSGLNEALCTAVGSTKLLGVIEKLISGEDRVYFGVQGEDIPSSALQEANLTNGIYVTEVVTDSPAFEAGIKTGDIILRVNGTSIYSYSGFHLLLNRYSVGEELTVTVQRTVRMSPRQVELRVVLSKK